MKKFFKAILWTVLIVLLVSIIALFIFIKTFDLNKYKDQITKIVYEQTGRDLKLNGHAGLKISLIPTIELNDVSFSNADWAKEPNMVSAKSIDISFSIIPLLKKEIVIDKIHLIEPKIYLSINEKGVPNWDFSSADKVSKQQSESKEKEAVVSGSDIAQGAMIASIVAKSFKIENGEIVYQDIKTKEKHNLQIKNIVITSNDMNDDINADIDVVYNNEAIKADVEAGSINSILQNKKDYPIKANIKAYGATAEIEGTLSELLGKLEYNLTIVANNPSGNMGAPDVKLSTIAKGNLENITLNIKSLNVASNEIKGNVEVALSNKTPKVIASFNATLINLQNFNQIKKVHNNFSFVSTANAASFIPPTAIDLSVLNVVNANVKLDVKKLIVNEDIELNNIKTDISVNNGNANVNINEIEVGKGKITGVLSANTKNIFDIKLTGNDIILQNMVKSLIPNNKDTLGIIDGGKTKIMINLTAKGKDVRELVENLNGQTIFIINESKVQMGRLKYLRGDFISQILNALKLKQSEKNLDVSCVVLRADILDGKANFPKGIAFKSNKITVVSDGFVNLKNDKIDLSIKPFNGKLADTNVAQAISSMLKISGTIQKPRLTIDNSSVIKNVVGIAAAGPAFLGSQFLLDVDDYPCYTALKGTSYENMYPAPSGVKATGKKIYQGASDVVTDGVNLVNDAAKGVINFLKGKK